MSFVEKKNLKHLLVIKKVSSIRENGIINYENIFNFFEADNNDECQDLNKATFSTQFVQNIIDRYVKKDDVVLDMFSGTGTTIYSCEQNEIKSYGIELTKNSANRKEVYEGILLRE